jgi:hypothetical protein
MCGRDLRLLWYALQHSSRPLWLLPVAALLGFYAVEPANFAIPLLGVVLPLILHGVVQLLPADIRNDFERRAFTR